jgi:hypothetical protein
MLVGRQPQTAIDWRKIAIARDDHGQTVLSLLATASDLQLVILTLKFRLEVLFCEFTFCGFWRFCLWVWQQFPAGHRIK